VDAVAADKVLVTSTAHEHRPERTTILNAARQMGITSTLCNYWDSAIRRLSCVSGRARNAARAAVGGLVQHPVSGPIVVHTDTDNVKKIDRRSWNCSWPGPESRELAEFAAGWASPPRRSNRGGRQVHPLRTVHSRLQPDDGARRDQSVRPRTSRGADSYAEPTTSARPAVPAYSSVRQVPSTCTITRAASGRTARARPVPEAPGRDRPGPSAGRPACAGHRPR